MDKTATISDLKIYNKNDADVRSTWPGTSQTPTDQFVRE